ncbi:MAG: hypothetical protein ACK4OM_03540 [Alphaproteobacteria bacterium]
MLNSKGCLENIYNIYNSKIRISILAFLLLSLINRNNANSGAWLQEKSHYQLIVEDYFDNIDQHSKGYRNYFLEYGISKKSNIGINIYSKKSRFKTTGQTYSYYKIKDPEKTIGIFHKKLIWNKKNWVVSQQNTMFLDLPSYENRIAIGKSFDKFLNGFINIEASYLVNSVSPINLSFDVTYGIIVSSNVIILMQSFNNYRNHKIIWFERNLYNDEIESVKPIWYKTYTSKLKFSTIFELNKNYSLQIGTAYSLNRNARKSDIFTSLWIKL